MSTTNELPIDMIGPDTSQDLAQLPPATRAALALKSSATEFELRALATKHAGITVIKDKAGREQAHGAAMELMRARTQIKKVADEARDDAKKFNQAVLAEEKRLTAIVEPEETRLKTLRDAWDTEQERIKLEAQRIERERLLKITERISEIKGYGTLAMGCRTAERVKSLIDKLAAIDLTGFDEYEPEAVKAHTDTIKAMGDQFRLLTEREAEAARLKAERAELERMRAEIEAAKAPPAAPKEEAAPVMCNQCLTLSDSMHRDRYCTCGDPKTGPGDDATHPNVAQVDTSTATEEAEIRVGFDMAMSAPIVKNELITDDAPPAASLIKCVADAYGVDEETACQWLCARADDFEAWTTKQF